MPAQPQKLILPFDLNGTNAYIDQDIFWIDTNNKWKGFYECTSPSVVINGANYQTEIDAALQAKTIMNSPAFLTNAARQLTWGTYLVGRGPKSLLNNVRRLTGRFYWAMDTAELWAYNGTDWVLLTNGPSMEVYHDDSLEGKGIPSDLLRILEPIKDYYSRNPDQWSVGNAVHGSIGGIRGIWKIEAVPSAIWNKTDVKYLNFNVQQHFLPGEYFYNDDPTYRNIYRVNSLISVFGSADLLGHINSGEVTGCVFGQPYTQATGSDIIYRWVSGQTYYQNDRVFDIFNNNTYYEFYTLAISSVTQTAFQAFTNVNQPMLLADISPATTSMIQIGMMIGWMDNLPLPPAGAYLRCDGSSVLKSTYQDLYQVLGGTFGETNLSFNLPTANNFIIKALP